MINNLNYKQKALYDTVGKTYDAARCADPEITQLTIKYLNPKTHDKYIDICYGTGNYTNAIHNHNINISGIDISEIMLKKAQAKNSSINWFQGDAHKLPFEDLSFDGALCINAIHHLGDLKSALKEIFRILKPNSKLIIFTSIKTQCENSWLLHYFPFIWDIGKNILQDETTLIKTIMDSGFNNIKFEKFFVAPDTQDLYLYTGKYKPEIYLNQTVRDDMTPFNMPKFSKEIAQGLKILEADILSGEVHNIIKTHEKNLGESTFVIAEKK